MAKASETEQLNFRFPPALAKSIREFCTAHPYKPSVTRLGELAFAEYMERHADELPPESAKQFKPKTSRK